jgi:hypothetical protein
MNETAVNLLVAIPVFLMYGSGLLLWPIRRWRHRKQKVRGRALAVVTITQLISYPVVAVLAKFIHLEHFYYWYFFLIELNSVLTLSGMAAWARDNRFERTLTMSHDE